MLRVAKIAADDGATRVNIRVEIQSSGLTRDESQHQMQKTLDAVASVLQPAVPYSDFDRTNTRISSYRRA